jgi:hypothetical protein
MRQLAAAMIIFRPSFDYEAAASLAGDKVANVRCELAISLKKLQGQEDRDSATLDQAAELISSLRNDPSFRVRAALPSADVDA